MTDKKAMKFITEYLEQYEPYKDHWNYEDGCTLIGCTDLFRVTGEQKYADFVQRYADERLDENGEIRNYVAEEHAIDNILSGRVLFFLYDRTGDEKYRKAAAFLKDQLMKQPRCKCGSFWHKDRYPNQVWLDGLYMAQPFYMEYETRWNGKECCSDVAAQFETVHKKLFNQEKGLYYHAWDEAGLQPWADKKTGLSPNFWLRSEGWLLMALIDTMDVMSIELYEQYDMLREIFTEAVKGILPYRDRATNLFYQITDGAGIKGNYLETSGSAMVAYAVLKGVRLGVLSAEKYEKIGRGILNGIIDTKLKEEDGILHLTGICKVAGLGPGQERDGSTAYYLSEPITQDDPKGVGPFMMAFAELMEEDHGKE